MQAADLERTVEFALDYPTIPPAWMIGARTRMLDCWAPQIEWIRIPSMTYPEQECSVGFRNNSVSTGPGGGNGRNILKRKDVRQEATDSFYDARRCGPDNPAHAILDGIITGLACRSAAESLGVAPPVVVLSESASPVIREIYRQLQLPVIATDKAVSGTQFFTNFNRTACIGLARHLLPTDLKNQLEAGHKHFPERVFIARRGSRSIRNRVEIEAMLQREGYTTVYMEDHSVIDQFRWLWHAHRVVAVHGAGLAPLLFRFMDQSKRPLRLIELFGPGYIVTGYREVVAQVGGNWVGVRGRITEEVVRDLDFQQGASSARRWWAAIRSLLRGKRFRREKNWQRTHQRADFEVDPESLQAAFRVAENLDSGPVDRVLSLETRWQ